MTALAPTLQAFFTERLTAQLGASPHTVAAYRDTFRLLLVFSTQRSGTKPSDLDLGDLDAGLIGEFLDHLEADRHNSVTTRNNRLAAIHSLFSFAARRHPEHAATIARVLAIEPKRFQRNTVTYLDAAETDALLAACDQTTWTGRRDHAMILLAVETGLRVSELIGLTDADVTFGTGANVRCVGKGRRQRATPLLELTEEVLAAWLAERGGAPGDPLFPTITGRTLSRDAIEHRIAHYVTKAAHRPLRHQSRGLLPVARHQARDRPHPQAHGGHEAAAPRGGSDGHRVVARACPSHLHRPLPPR